MKSGGLTSVLISSEWKNEIPLHGILVVWLVVLSSCPRRVLEDVLAAGLSCPLWSLLAPALHRPGHPLPLPWHRGSAVRSSAVRAGLVEGKGIIIHYLKNNCYWAISIWMQGHCMVLSDELAVVLVPQNTHFYISILSQKVVSLTPINLIAPLDSIRGTSSFVPVNSPPESSQWSCVKQFTIRALCGLSNIRAFWPNHMPKGTKVMKKTHFQSSVPTRGFQRGWCSCYFPCLSSHHKYIQYSSSLSKCSQSNLPRTWEGTPTAQRPTQECFLSTTAAMVKVSSKSTSVLFQSARYHLALQLWVLPQGAVLPP